MVLIVTDLVKKKTYTKSKTSVWSSAGCRPAIIISIIIKLFGFTIQHNLPGLSMIRDLAVVSSAHGHYILSSSQKLALVTTTATLVPRATLRGVAELHVASGMPQWQMFVTSCYI